MKEQDKSKKDKLKELEKKNKLPNKLKSAETKSKKADKEFKELETLRTIFDAAGDGIILIESDMPEKKKFYTGNKMICQMLGYSLEEIKNLGLTDIHPKENIPYILEQIERQVRKEVKVAKDLPVKRKDGSIFYADINSSPITIGGKTYLMGIFRDISDRKQTEDALRKSEKQYSRIIETANEGIWMIDPELKTSYINQRMAEMLGYTVQEMLGRNLLDFIDDDARIEVEQGFVKGKQAIKGQSDSRLIRKDGSTLWAIVTSNPIFDDNGKLLGSLGMFTDITDRKRTEKELQKHRDHLEELIKERTAELEKINEKLKQEIAEGKRREEIISQQTHEILELSTPVVQVWEGVVAAPLIGTLDSERTQLFMERLLNSVVETNSPVALVDITGVPAVDTQTAHHLIEAITAARLLGTKVILTGVRPAIAQTLVHLGIELSDIETKSSLAAGLKVALDILGLKIVRNGEGI